MPRHAATESEALAVRQGAMLARTRRHFFHECGVGVGKIALAGLFAESVAAPGMAAEAPVGTGA